MKSFKTSIFVPVLLGMTLVSSSAKAADQAGKYGIHAGVTCSSFLEEEKKDSWAYLAGKSWIADYLTAYNELTPKTVSILGCTDIGGAVLWVKNYCEKQPLSTVSQAMTHLTVELYPRRTQKAP